MKNRIISLILTMLIVIGLFPTSALAEEIKSEDIVILYENDVHCALEGYSKLSAMKKELKQSYANVGVVSCGDYIQGNSLGVISRGEYAVELMNLVGYDAVTLGNHEFDFRIDRLCELVGMMNTAPICCNFQKIGEDSSYFDPYKIVSYGEIDIAYIGITTPHTITSSSPAQFKDENGEYKYTFNPQTFYDLVQSSIDAAEAEGADYVIAISHIGYADDEVYGDLEDVEDLIRNTDGLDVVLDGHSHSVIEDMRIADREGNEVLLTSTGTKFEYIGRLTISNGEFTTELIKTADYQGTDPVVDARIAEINEEHKALGERKVAYSDVDLITHNADGDRLVRMSETNLGDLCADAMRYAVSADIGYLNGGGIRAEIQKGDVTFNDLLGVFPFNNTVVLAEVSGQTIKDMMEMAVMAWPGEDGCFPHLSGIRFSVNTAIPSSVEVNEFEEFVGVLGEYRVYNIEIFNRETEKYEPIDLAKTYTISASNYFLLEYGSGMTMLKDARIIQNEGILDVEALEGYISEVLGGVIGEEYAEVQANITFTDGVIETPTDKDDQQDEENNDQPESPTDPTLPETPSFTEYIIPTAIGLSCLAALVALAVIIRKRKLRG